MTRSKNPRTHSVASVAAVVLGLVCLTSASAQVTTYRLVPNTVYEARPVKVYRLHEETVVEQQPVTTYKTESVTEMRERTYRVAKPVVETSEKVQRYKVLKPVTETSFREQSREVTTYETETRWRKQERTVKKPVKETSEREERVTVMRPVTEVEMREQSYTAYRPVTRRELQWRDQSQVFDVPSVTPGDTRTRLRWLGRTNYTDPRTGLQTTQRAGFYWVPEQEQRYTTQRVFVPNYVPQEVARTAYEPETVTRKVPVERTRFEQVERVRTVPVTTYRQVEQQQFRYVPETVRKPITKTETRKIPVTTTRWVEQEVVRKIPVKTYKVEWEERTEKYPVTVERTVPVREMVERERTISRYLPEEREQIVAKTVMTKELIADECVAPTLYGEVETVISQPASETVFSTSEPYTTSYPSTTIDFGNPVLDAGAGWQPRSLDELETKQPEAETDSPTVVNPPANQDGVEDAGGGEIPLIEGI